MLCNKDLEITFSVDGKIAQVPYRTSSIRREIILYFYYYEILKHFLQATIVYA